VSDEEIAARRPGRGVIGLVLALALIAAVTGFFLLKKPAEVNLNLALTPGEALRYHMTLDVSGITLAGTSPAPAEDEIQADITWRVISVDGTGTATIVQVVTDPTMRSNGRSVTLADPPSTKITVGADGQVRTGSGANLFPDGTAGPAQAGIARPLAFLPGYAVRPGDTWSTQVSQAFWGSTLSYGATTTFLRLEPLGSVQAAVVESDATVPVDLTVKVVDFAGALALPTSPIPKDATASYAGSLTDTTTTSWIDPSTGSLLKTVSRGTFSLDLALKGFPKSVLNGDGTGTLSGELSLELSRL
jgi:hypothetical protein